MIYLQEIVKFCKTKKYVSDKTNKYIKESQDCEKLEIKISDEIEKSPQTISSSSIIPKLEEEYQVLTNKKEQSLKDLHKLRVLLA